MTHEPTIRDVLDAMSVFSTHVDKRFDRIESDVKILNQDVSVLKQDVSVLKQDVSVLKRDMSSLTYRMDTVQTTMVTKDYMEGRLAAMAR